INTISGKGASADAIMPLPGSKKILSLDKSGKVIIRSFLSGLQARDMAVEKNLNVPPEEAFICTLLHNLGKIIVCIYLPEKYREIEQKISNGMSEDGASKAILSDLTYNDVGQEVARFWNLSEKAIASMDNNPPKPGSNYDTEGYLQNLAHFSNNFVDKLCDGSDLTPLMDRYGEMLSVDAAEVVERVLNCVEVSEDVSDSIRYGLNKLKIRSRLTNIQKNVENGVLSSAKPVGKVDAKQAAAKKAAEEHEHNLDGLNELPISTDKSVDDFIRDITETLMGPFDINDFYANLLEGLYRGVGFDRVILSIISVQPTKMCLVGRFGLGEVDPAGVGKFEHDLAKSSYAIPLALKACKDMMIPANKKSAFPDDLQYLVKNRNVYLFPICIDGKGIGMIYLDRKAGRPNLDKSRIKTVRLFRDFAVMAIRKIRKNN
nr:HDOD domain-containing protein [Desulfobulbaceae bacterium]